jgi:hypothetical protein
MATRIRKRSCPSNTRPDPTADATPTGRTCPRTAPGPSIDRLARKSSPKVLGPDVAAEKLPSGLVAWRVWQRLGRQALGPLVASSVGPRLGLVRGQEPVPDDIVVAV